MTRCPRAPPAGAHATREQHLSIARETSRRDVRGHRGHRDPQTRSQKTDSEWSLVDGAAERACASIFADGADSHLELVFYERDVNLKRGHGLVQIFHIGLHHVET